MSCMYDVKQSPSGVVTHIDVFEAVYNALQEDIEAGRVFLSEYPSARRVLVFFEEVDVTEIPSDIAGKLKAAWINVFEGPYDVQVPKDEPVYSNTHHAPILKLVQKL